MAAKSIQTGDPIVWMHASSLGEFEQGRPLLEMLKKHRPEWKLALSFFSPSGYEPVKNSTLVDLVFYLPYDTPVDAPRVVKMLKPIMVFWVKYEYWFHHLKSIHDAGVPLFLVSGIYRHDQPFFKWYGGLHRQMLAYFTHFFVQHQAAADLLQTLVSPEKISISGDTRFDRVIDIAENWQGIEAVENWLQGANKVLVAGSTWPDDEEELVHYFRTNPDVKLIIAPHQIEQPLLADTRALFPNSRRFSQLIAGQEQESFQVLIIDNVGMLNRLYRYATVAYVGGGFAGDGVHNVLEAAVYGRPVVHGPEYEKYAEATGLLAAGGSLTGDSAIELEKVFDSLFKDQEYTELTGSKARNYVYAHAGGSKQILNYLSSNGLLT